MQASYSEGTGPVCTPPSVIELGCGSASWRPSVSETRPYIIRLGSKHEALLSALLSGLDKSSRINRFGYPATDARVQRYAKEAMARAAYVAGAFDAGRLIGVVEVFEPSRDGVAEAAFAVAADWRRQGVGADLLAAARRWAEQSGIRTLRMFISRNNWPMRRFAHNAGARLDLDLQILADIAVPTAASLDIAAARGTFVPDGYRPRVDPRFSTAVHRRSPARTACSASSSCAAG